MDTLSLINLFSLTGSLALSIFVYFKDPGKKLNRLFALFCLITSIWIATNFIDSVNYSHELWFRTTYALAPIVIASAVAWVIELCRWKTKTIYAILILFFCALCSLLPFAGNLLFRYLVDGNFIPGTLFVLYFAYFAVLVIYLFYILIKTYSRSKGAEKLQIGYVMVGILFPGTVGIISSALLPMLGISIFTNIDSPSMLFFTLLTAFAITRYHLFEAKIILSEILVGATGIFLFFLPFIIDSPGLKAITLLGFLTYIAFGYYLVKTIHEERRRKERAERFAEGVEKFNELLEASVAQRTKKLQEKTDELEKFYKLSIGRELEMAELKNKIREMESREKK